MTSLSVYYLPHVDGKISLDAMIAGGKLKLYCTQCFEAHIIEVKEKEAKDYTAGRRANPGHMRADIETTPPYWTCSLSPVAANSASCECLFSAFGDVLTRKWNHLSANNLHTLAEHKLHIWNELREQKTGACIDH